LTQIRCETPQDYPAVYEVNQSAFGRHAEADLVEELRKAAQPTLSLVAEQDGQVVGHIFFSPVTVKSPAGDWTGMGLGPMAVAPAWQGQGIGAQLVQRGLQACRDAGRDAGREAGHEAGWEVVVVLGHSEFYPRFGFKISRPLGITCSFPVPDEAFMVAELQPRALGGRSGVVHYHPAFNNV
jgi:putative acetyltransferase